MQVLWEKPSIFLSPLGSLISRYFSFQFILKLSCSKPFHNTLNYASTTNTEEVMKFYNLGDKTFETDFGQNGRECVIRLVSLPHIFRYVQQRQVSYVAKE